ncbi:unnamed protein product [Didymodactylos carnosus]|uniref:Uncharacterized protein n=1 Tax=Didymodactylos carnosus TaxID=1234261 RepID=A0A8S2EDH1_9BILA|nr:unnamed protein product [Didymodactylos carnosus]CAF4007708.1 unnamed protein product [Didymodactylos carnosus]
MTLLYNVTVMPFETSSQLIRPTSLRFVPNDDETIDWNNEVNYNDEVTINHSTPSTIAAERKISPEVSDQSKLMLISIMWLILTKVNIHKNVYHLKPLTTTPAKIFSPFCDSLSQNEDATDVKEKSKMMVKQRSITDPSSSTKTNFKRYSLDELSKSLRQMLTISDREKMDPNHFCM